MANNDRILTIMRFIPKHETIQKYGAIISDTLTNQAMKESDAEKTDQAPTTSPGKTLKAIAKIEGTGVSPGVHDVPTYGSEDEQISLEVSDRTMMILISVMMVMTLFILSYAAHDKKKDKMKTIKKNRSADSSDEALAKNEDFLNKLDDNIKKIIKSTKTSYVVAANLSELELKKILIHKMENNKSINRSVPQKNLYKALVDDYESDKDNLASYGDTDFDCPSLEVIALITEVVALKPVASTGSPFSTTIDQDAPSPSNSQTIPKTQSLVIPNDVEEDNHDLDVAHMNNDPFYGILIPENNSEASSSSNVIPTIVQTAAPNSEHVTK
ncbi:hypothetical protein Tco_1315405 [Tanacetum coccineum]